MTEDTKRGPGRPPKAPQMVQCEVLRDFWPTENQQDRVRKGTIVEMDPMQAIEAIENGSARRVK